jgi:hypothetical protein
MMALEYVRALQHLGGEPIHVALVTNGHTDKGRYVFADFLTINHGLISLNDSASLQFLHTLHHSRRRKLNLFSYICEASATIIL